MTRFGGACSKGCSWPFYVQWCMGQMNKGNWDFDGGKKKKKLIHLNAFNFGRGCHFLVFGKPLLNSSSDPLFDN